MQQEPSDCIDDLSNCNKNNDSRVERLHDSKTLGAPKVNFEFSSSDDENVGESCASVTGITNKGAADENKNVQHENEVVSDASDSPSPSIVSNVPSLNLVSTMDDIQVDNELNNLDPLSVHGMQSELSPRSSAITSNNDNLSPSVNNDNLSTSNNINSVSTGLVRSICKYADKCYRKNPQHKVDFSHPGDDDFTTVDGRPECEYGISCYRKNPLHRQHYKHTKKVLQPRKAKQHTTKINNVNSSDEDDYDLDDPFINDGSSDDYEPEGSDDTDLSDQLDESGE